MTFPLSADLDIHSSQVLDLLPFVQDNVTLASTRGRDEKLRAVLANEVQAEDAGKYTWLRSHEIIDWKEETWVARLYHCLKRSGGIPWRSGCEPIAKGTSVAGLATDSIVLSNIAYLVHPI